MASYAPVRLAYNILEPSTGVDQSLTPVLFLHGVTASKEHWIDIAQIVANKTKRKVYTLDARNHGESEWSDIYNFDMNVDDLFHFMDLNNLPKAILVGHSMGGMTSIKAAINKPEKIEKIIVEDMVVRKVPPPLADMVSIFVTVLRTAIQNVPSDLDEDAAKLFIYDFVWNATPEEIKKQLKRDNVTYKYLMIKSKDGRYEYMANMEVIEKTLQNYETFMSEPKGVYEGPAYFIYGDESIFKVGDDQDHIKQHFPKAEFICIKGATHNVHTDCPKEFSEEVLKILKP